MNVSYIFSLISFYFKDAHIAFPSLMKYKIICVNLRLIITAYSLLK